MQDFYLLFYYKKNIVAWPLLVVAVFSSTTTENAQITLTRINIYNTTSSI